MSEKTEVVAEITAKDLEEYRENKYKAEVLDSFFDDLIDRSVELQKGIREQWEKIRKKYDLKEVQHLKMDDENGEVLKVIDK